MMGYPAERTYTIVLINEILERVGELNSWER
jgi:hypothetical protein